MEQEDSGVQDSPRLRLMPLGEGTHITIDQTEFLAQSEDARQLRRELPSLKIHLSDLFRDTGPAVFSGGLNTQVANEHTTLVSSKAAYDGIGLKTIQYQHPNIVQEVEPSSPIVQGRMLNDNASTIDAGKGAAIHDSKRNCQSAPAEPRPKISRDAKVLRPQSIWSPLIRKLLEPANISLEMCLHRSTDF